MVLSPPTSYGPNNFFIRAVAGCRPLLIDLELLPELLVVFKKLVKRLRRTAVATEQCEA